MRVLLDECVPRALRGELHGHEVKTVAEAGFAGVKNGKLLELQRRSLTFSSRLTATSSISKTSLA